MSCQLARCLAKVYGRNFYSQTIFLRVFRKFSFTPRTVQKHRAQVFALPAALPATKPKQKEHKEFKFSEPLPNASEAEDSNTDHHRTNTKCSEDIKKQRYYEKTQTVVHNESTQSCETFNISRQSYQDSKDIEKSMLTNQPEMPNLENFNELKLLNVVKSKDLDWHKQTIQLEKLMKYYMSLAKIRLTGLVVLTTATGYGMATGPFEPVTFLYAVLGTAFMSAAANSINQFLEVPYDSQMSRTKNRVLVKGLLTSLHAASFAVVSSTLGISLLYFGVNELTAALGLLNLLLYTSVYTPLKRCSIVNTWVGSVVGAIPPLMGWTACTGSLSSSAVLLGAILFSWQFPHFNALSWNLRQDYSRAGYRMMSVVNPELCRKTALRHSVAILIFCSAAPLVELTTWTFAFDSLPLNCYLVYCAWKFYKNADSQSSRKLFRLSLIHLPALMFLMFIGKKRSSTNKKNSIES